MFPSSRDPTLERGVCPNNVIGSNGVFPVETKTRRKIKGENGAKVTVLEHALQYPRGIDREDLAQAQEDARCLAIGYRKCQKDP